MKRKSCFVCRRRSNWFYENIFYLRTKHSERTISAVMNIILGDSVCLIPAAMCFKCVDRINAYDEAYEKMQKMEREFKSLICVKMITKLPDAEAVASADAMSIPTDDVITDPNGVDGKEMDADQQAGDTVLVNLDGAVNIEPAEPALNDQEASIGIPMRRM